jgi:hypothetical protein
MDWSSLQGELVPEIHPPGILEVMVVYHEYDTLIPDLLLPVPYNKYKTIMF